MSGSSGSRVTLLQRALVTLQVFLLVATMVTPAATLAFEPSPDPSTNPSTEPSPESSVEPTPAPSAEPTPAPEPSAEPTPEPTAAPDPTAEPPVEPDPTVEPSATPDPTVEPTPDPTIDPSATPDPTPEPTPAPMATSPYLVTFVAGTSQGDQAAALAAVGAIDKGSIPALRMHAIELVDGSTAIGALIADPTVQRLDADRLRAVEATPNDPSFGDQWALERIGWTDVFGAVTPSGNAVVALLDTGVDASHPDLAGQLVSGTSIVAGGSATSDPHGHGTWLAGIIAASTDNGSGVAGVGYAGVKVMPITVLDADGLGQDSDIIEGIVWAVQHGADVINMSFSNPGYSPALQAAIDYAWSNDVVLVAAVGNDGSSTVAYPAGDRGVIGVSNTTSADGLAGSSNRGEAVFLGAPGTDIVTTGIGGGVTSVTGTSASSAVVAAAAALLRAADPSASNGTIVGRLARSADAVGTADETGNGRLNLARAMGDTSTDPIQPALAGAAGDGGPFVGPYVAATTNVDMVTLGAQSPNPVVRGSSATYQVNIVADNPSGGDSTIYVNLTVSGLATGLSGSFSSSCVTISGDGTYNNVATLTITTTSSAPASDTFTVSAQGGNQSSCSNSNRGNDTVDATITTTAPVVATTTVASGANAIYGAATVGLTATVSPSSASVGTVLFTVRNGLTVIGTATSGTVTAGAASATFNLSGVNAGTYTIEVAFSGGTGYAASNNNSQSPAPTLVVAKADQTITFGPLGDKTYGDADFTIGASASSYLGVGFTSTTPSVCTVSVTTVTIIAAGTCTIDANQGGNGNYNPAPTVTRSFTIGTRAVEITADAKSKTYGDGDPALTYQITDGSLAFSDAFTGDLARDAGESVGTYAITQGTVALDANYVLTFVGDDLTIGTRAVEITADAKSKTYGDGDPALTYQITDGSLAFSDAFTGDLARDAGESVGTYAITQGTVALDANYVLTFVGDDLTIGTRAVEITADAKSKTYGDGDPALTYQITDGSLAFSDAFTGDLARDAGESVGTYAITQGTVALDANYVLTFVGDDLTIGTRAVEITADAKSKTYGDGDPALTYQITDGSLAFSDAFTGDLARDAGESVGTYAITQGTVALDANYVLTFVGDDLTIGTRAVEITADAKSKTYGDGDPALTYQITDGSLAFSDAFTGDLARDAGESVGTYAITQGTVALDANYVLTFVGDDLTIGTRAVEITADAKSKTYGDGDPALTYQITDGSLAFSDAFTGDLARDAGESVGTYAITQGTVALDANYVLTFVGDDLTIGTRAVEITADAKSKTYGDGDPALTYQITDGSLAFSDAFTGDLARDAGESVGTYAITQGTVALDANYVLTFVGDDLTIGTRAVEITADAKSKTYGDGDPALTYQITDGSLAFSDAFTGDLARDAGESVGTYAITQGTVALDANYVLTFVGDDLTIGTRAVEITADAKSKTYGDGDPALTYQITDGSLAFSDAFTGDLARDAGESVGTYAITQGTVALDANYVLTFVGDDLTIGTRAVEITADAKSKTYGDGDPALTYQITDGSLAFSDAFTGDLARDAGESVGTYAITQGTVALDANYVLTFVGDDLTIGQAPLSVTPANKTKVYGDVFSAFTGSIVGIKNLDAITATYASAGSPATATVAGSQYTITATLVDPGSKLANYDITYNTGTLTVTPRPITVTATAKSKTLGGVDPALTYTYTGTLVNGEVFTGSLVRVPGESVGSYSINQSTLALNGNYTITYVGGAFRILYAWTGYLQPINDTAHQTGVSQSKFKTGQTIPVKFVLKDALGNTVTQASSPTFTRTGNLGNCDLAASPETLPTVTPDSGSIFKLTSGQYHYNWSTKGLSSGEYRIFAVLADGTMQSVDICLTK